MERGGGGRKRERPTKDIIGLVLLVSGELLGGVAGEPGISGVEGHTQEPAIAVVGMVGGDDGAAAMLDGVVTAFDGGQPAQKVVVVVHAVVGHGGHGPRDRIARSAARAHQIARQRRRRCRRRGRQRRR